MENDSTKFSRVWAMPSHNTFDIKPIGEFVKKYLRGVSVDPFARDSTLCDYTNDLNPNTKAKYHLQATDFLEMLKSQGVKANTIILDPPYSPRQISECYKELGITSSMADTQTARMMKEIRDLTDDVLADGGVVLSFGWNSVGMGIKRGYSLEEILLVCHGGAHNDTICLCEKKIGGLVF